jgi:hypothetical protein
MNNSRNPYIRVPIAIAVIAMLFFTATREFLKLTFMLGIPFVFVMAFMVKQRQKSLTWGLSALALVALMGVYGYFLIHLPQRIKIREITANGAALVAQGQYDEAITLYERLGPLGKPDKMQSLIAEAETEKDAHMQLEKARQLTAEGYQAEAQEIVDALPTSTRAYQEAKELKKQLEP